MQGFDVRHDRESAYRTTITPPEDWTGLRVLLRFEGVYDYARVWINDRFVRDHIGGFTRWDADVTDLVTPGQPAQLTVGVTDRWESVSVANRYAMHAIGGILRPVSLLAVPPTHVSSMHTHTTLADGSATLEVSFQLTGPARDSAHVTAQLLDPDGAPVATAVATGGAHRAAQINIAQPRLWTAETPHLYQLRVIVTDADRTTTISQRLGMRTVERSGNRLLVNGKPVTLRGVNHHDSHPTLGRTSDGTLDRSDLMSFKKANINFVRTSHYPPHPALLDAADELGIYVEAENAVCWADQFGWPATQDDPDRRAEYLTQFAEMIERDRNHPSVILWSLGNESTWGANFQAEYDYVKRQDPSRPVIMSFPGGPEDLVSSHYPPYGPLAVSNGRPVLHDEALTCLFYQISDFRRDPAIRLDWSDTLRALVETIEGTPGHVGIVIWAGIDEMFLLPHGATGYGPWGILDIWRRQKPEWWAVKKAFSPVRVQAVRIAPAASDTVRLQITNRYDFLPLSALSLRWRLGEATGNARLPAVQPGDTAMLDLPVRGTGDVLCVDFMTIDDALIDRYEFPIVGAAPTPAVTLADRAPLSCTVRDNTIRIRGNAFTVEVDRRTGALCAANSQDRLIMGGPRLHLVGARLDAWACDAVTYQPNHNVTTFNIDGRHGSLRISYQIDVAGDGTITTDYGLSGTAPDAPRGVAELGIRFDLDADLERATWRTDPTWLAAPSDHLARADGTAHKANAPVPAYRATPTWLWQQDRWDPLSDGPADQHAWSLDFRARRALLRKLELYGRTGHTLTVTSDGSQSSRLFPITERVLPGDERVTLLGTWRAGRETGWLEPRSEHGFELVTEDENASVTIRFHGSGIEWIGSRGPRSAIVDVHLNNELVAAGLDLYSSFQVAERVLFAARNLTPTDHVLRITAVGRTNRAATGHTLTLDHLTIYPNPPYPTALAVIDRTMYPATVFDWADPSTRNNAVDVIGHRGKITLHLAAV